MLDIKFIRDRIYTQNYAQEFKEILKKRGLVAQIGNFLLPSVYEHYYHN